MTYTTIDIADLTRVKHEALNRGITLRELVNRSIKMCLSERVVEIENPKRVKEEAAKRNITLKELVNSAVKKCIEEEPRPEAK